MCDVVPANGCRYAPPGAATVKVKDSGDDLRDQFTWTWKRGLATSLQDFKDPVNGTATYRVCVYDGSGAAQPVMNADLPPGGTCGTKPCWKPSGATGYAYRNKAATPDGLVTVRLKAGATGKPRIQIVGKGINLQTPALPLTLPVTVQLVVRDDASTECWQTIYSTARVNDGARFVANGP